MTIIGILLVAPPPRADPGDGRSRSSCVSPDGTRRLLPASNTPSSQDGNAPWRRAWCAPRITSRRIS